MHHRGPSDTFRYHDWGKLGNKWASKHVPMYLLATGYRLGNGLSGLEWSVPCSFAECINNNVRPGAGNAFVEQWHEQGWTLGPAEAPGRPEIEVWYRMHN